MATGNLDNLATSNRDLIHKVSTAQVLGQEVIQAGNWPTTQGLIQSGAVN